MKDIEDKLAAFLMDYGVLKNRDAENMVGKIVEMFEKEREDLLGRIERAKVTESELLADRDRICAEHDQLAEKLDRISRHVRCMYCNKEYSFEESDQLADHIMNCEKSPVVDMVHKMEHRIMDYMDLMNDEFQRILAITDNQEIIGICERAQQVIAQKEPVIKQRDDAIRERDQLAAKCAEIDSPTWPWVRGFASEMERKLAKNRHKGDAWSKDSPEALFDRLIEEASELNWAICSGTQEQVRGEAADVANFAMMIADVAGGLEPHKQGGSGWLSPSEREKLEAKCASLIDLTRSAYSLIIEHHSSSQMREELIECPCCSTKLGNDILNWLHAAYSNPDDCGKGWLSPEKKERLKRFTSHTPQCARFDFPVGTKPCDCGLEQAIDETK